MNAAPATRLDQGPIDERLLPPVTRRIVGAIGVAATMRLLKARGGTRLWVPKNSGRSDVLVGILGRELAEQLVKAFADELVITLPKADKMLAQVRDAAIRREHVAGDSMAALALRYDLTERHVLNIVQSSGRPVWRAPERDLFGDLA